MSPARGVRAWPAPLVALAQLAVFLGVAGLLGVRADDGSDESAAFVAGVPWLVWRVVGAAAVLVFLAVLLQGLGVLRRRASWGLGAGAGRHRAYLAVAAAVVLLAMLAQLRGARNPDLPVADLAVRTRVVLWAGLVAAVPWLALVWLAHDECRRGVGPDPPAPSGLDQLLRLWRLVVAVTGAFAAGVVAAILTSGALRAAFVASHPTCAQVYPPPATPPAGVVCAESFPPSDVLYYGAFFAVLLLVIAVPLALSWRARALELVDRTYPWPDDGRPTDAVVGDRARLAAVLHLDVPLLRNPLTALSLFAPLATSLLAAFVPQLGSG